MTMDDLKGRMDVDDKDLNKHLLSLEKRGLASLYRDRRGEIALARATYKGLGASHPLEYYKYVPEWVDARDLF
jgi:hypothetical protein